ncbi:hypothetical protein FF38_06861 [Lucilia cuprina]|uniref:Uncharacterized protein n=1 Tax=Lucilia cuprina TaxID=7375 RepID=A0A0L0CMK8_LUCCU|nr:hypothetical protein CVS40_9158 [Lucilia cuprina]KNC33588.1 hypothetical protein FF38_06861 [Lucilia cuprina]
MSKVIEIIDSDDDNHASIDTPSTSITSSTISSMEQDDNQQGQSRRRRRKSVLHAMNDPDMHFLTISLEDDDDEAETPNSTPATPIQRYQAKSTSTAGTSSRTLLKTPRITPKILANKPLTSANIVDAKYEKFLNDPETISDLYAIAEERARINYLLSLNGMPEINFSLYTRPERLQFQLEERLKQRKMVHNWDNARMQENRRSLLQKNNEQNTT